MCCWFCSLFLSLRLRVSTLLYVKISRYKYFITLLYVAGFVTDLTSTYKNMSLAKLCSDMHVSFSDGIKRLARGNSRRQILSILFALNNAL